MIDKKQLTIIVVFLLIFATIFIATGISNGEKHSTSTTSSQNTTTNATSHSTTTEKTSSSPTTTFSPSSSTIVTAAKLPIPNKIVTLPEKPDYIHITVQAIAISNKSTQTVAEEIYYSVDGTTKETITIYGTSKEIITHILSGDIETIINNETTKTTSSIIPDAVMFIGEYYPFAVENNTTFYTAIKGPLGTATLTIFSDGKFTLDYTRIVEDGTNRFENIVKASGTLSEWETSDTYTVYSKTPSITYPWIKGKTIFLPYIVLAGKKNEISIIANSTEVRTHTDEMVISFHQALASNEIMTLFMSRIHHGTITSKNGTIGEIGVEENTLFETYTGGDDVVITEVIRTATDGYATITTTIKSTDGIKYFYVIYGATIAGYRTIKINGTPVLIVSYCNGNLTVPVTFGASIANYAFAYKVFTDNSGGYEMIAGNGNITLNVVKAYITTVSQ